MRSRCVRGGETNACRGGNSRSDDGDGEAADERAVDHVRVLVAAKEAARLRGGAGAEAEAGAGGGRRAEAVQRAGRLPVTDLRAGHRRERNGDMKSH